MSLTILTILGLLVLFVGLIVSLRIVQQQKEEKDKGVSSTVKANPRILNPILLSYVLVVAIVFMVIWFFKMYYKYPF